MLSSSIYGSQMATFKKNTFLKKNNTFVRLVKKGHMVEGQQLLLFKSVSLIASSNLFKFLLYLL
jgi:hypothetical protein